MSGGSVFWAYTGGLALNTVGNMSSEFDHGVESIATGEAGRNLGNRAVGIYENQSGRKFTGTFSQWHDFANQMGNEVIGIDGMTEGLEGHDMATGRELSGAERGSRFAGGLSQFSGFAAAGAGVVGTGTPVPELGGTTDVIPPGGPGSGIIDVMPEAGPGSGVIDVMPGAGPGSGVVDVMPGEPVEPMFPGNECPVPSENDYVNLASEARTNHILYGDGPSSGGHMWPGQPGKTPFPQDWDAGRIMHEVSDVATDPNSTWTQQTGPAGSLYTRAGDPARFAATGDRGGVPIKVIVEPAGEGIITAYPEY